MFKIVSVLQGINKEITSNQCVCLILNHKFADVWKNWYHGEKCKVSLEDVITYKKTAEIKNIQIQYCRVTLSPI